jgi:hypothetical protein
MDPLWIGYVLRSGISAFDYLLLWLGERAITSNFILKWAAPWTNGLIVF